MQEKINLLNEEHLHESDSNDALHRKIERYNRLKKIIEDINKDLSIESIADTLTEIAFSLIAENKGICMLYLIDTNNRVNLKLSKAKKENKDLIIKEKEGDIFDYWVLRHTSPLLVEDIGRDFRFDLERIRGQDTRSIGSLISVPFISDHRFYGILRLEHPKTNFYSQDDLRLLATICDFGAVALENGELFQKTQDLAIHDELTSLYTKGYFLERLEEECRRSLRQRHELSLLMIDIDYFKKYNDTFGHPAGDMVLAALSEHMTEELKEVSSIISRFGGEEFAVILPGADKKKALKVAERFRARIEKAKFLLRKKETTVTVSLGAASFPDDAKDKDELIIKADRALYRAKQEGRNRTCQ